MTSDKKSDPQTDPQAADFEGSENVVDINAQDNAQDQDLGQEPAEAETDPMAILVAENEDLKDRLLRTVADMENLRKRTEREVNDGRIYAIANFARDMLTATDSLSAALLVLPAEARDNADASMKSLIQGIEMTEREMQRLLQKNGVKPILAEGEKFDPHMHQAMFEVPDSDAPNGTVVQVVQAGFVIGERILRPAMVGIAKRGPKKPASDTPPAAGDVHIDKKA